jgi:acyl-CoA synthetase (AMP-forming)/AMP-acid ligase II
LINQPAIIDLWLACVTLGVIVVPINVLYREREIAHIVQDAVPVAVVTTAAQASLLPAGTVWWDVAALSREMATAPAERQVVPLAAADLAAGDGPAAPLVAWDDLGAGEGQIVAFSEGGEAAQPFRPADKPVDAYVAALIDRIDMPRRIEFRLSMVEYGEDAL